MKFIHLADLHIGKRIANYSLLEDQEFILKQILKEAQKFKPDCFLLCGDIFDRSVPSEEAVQLYNTFITSCSKLAPVFMIAGNHDSGIRLELFNDLLEKSDIYIEGSYQGQIKKISKVINNEKVNFYLLPFFSPSEVRYLKGKPVKTYQEALEAILEEEEINKDDLNILLAHQFFVKDNPVSNSEPTLEIGNLEAINIDSLKDFDYVALGHLHNQHKVGHESIRYCGTPMKYTLNDQTKFLNLITLDKDNLEIKKVELEPLHDIQVIEGTFSELINSNDINKNFVVINLLDKKVIPNVKASLLNKFPNLLQIKYNFENKESIIDSEFDDILNQSSIELLEDFFKKSNFTLTSEEKKLAQNIFTEIEDEIENETIIS